MILFFVPLPGNAANSPGASKVLLEGSPSQFDAQQTETETEENKRKIKAESERFYAIDGKVSNPFDKKGDNSPATGSTAQMKTRQPTVSYVIDAQLLKGDGKLLGKQTLTWRNTSETAVDHLRFHLYFNAFRDENSTYMRESKYYRKSNSQLAAMRFGEIKITEMEVAGGELLTEKIHFIAPDDANREDRTVMEVNLENPVSAGNSITLKMEFVLTVPEIFENCGSAGDYFFFSQWFPKIGVLQKDGLWNCHQYHRNSEYFADFGDYKVRLTLPGEFVVGATGNLVKKDKNADRSVTYLYEEKNIHDFAWTAYPRFVEFSEKIQLPGKKEATEIHMLLPPGHVHIKDRYLDSLKYTLTFLSRNIFPYPYKRITLADPPIKGLGSGGMEYPTLFTTSFHSSYPDAFKVAETVTIHEMIHQYFYGMVGSDEFREAWLDEGVTTFFELEILEEYFKDSADFLDLDILPIRGWERYRFRYAGLLPVDTVNQYSWNFLNGSHYGGNVYAKAGIFLKSLKNLVGKEKMYGFFKYYAMTYLYKHPTTDDFIDAFNTFMGEDYTWAFNQFINGTSKLDQSVYRLESVKIGNDPGKYRNEAVFLRNEGYFPVELLVKLENGKELKTFWKENERWKKIIFYDESPIKYAAVDPQYKLPLDYNFLNNSIVREPDNRFITRLSLKFGFYLQNVMGFLIF
ncbi:MAG: M1 family metallopeptidase [bacterium]|nr:M1 family metallopeptidase [bacterium]